MTRDFLSLKKLKKTKTILRSCKWKEKLIQKLKKPRPGISPLRYASVEMTEESSFRKGGFAPVEMIERGCAPIGITLY